MVHVRGRRTALAGQQPHSLLPMQVVASSRTHELKDATGARVKHKPVDHTSSVQRRRRDSCRGWEVMGQLSSS